ncbi:uncharacterized protein BDW43DRAFT_305906 [Aspergillus alliaceus]|uniref:uncharacterized protein n=1 Tax=Petromyces alliaceus TaxID=209559 RepID=UPI0012A50FF8|nr:uncharacterized protein BDW43DRAFT_305906 [Aspergillus alliaceus]KAB8239021.1 hypothetical protein BDW43DRAFT_305906 [Aspergillus alliaceus]
MGQTQPFADPETNPPEPESASVIETRYVRMLLELDYIPWFYNTSASAAHWALLAGYLVIPGTFTSLQKSDFLTEGLETNRTGKAILNCTFYWILGAKHGDALSVLKHCTHFFRTGDELPPILSDEIAGNLSLLGRGTMSLEDNFDERELRGQVVVEMGMILGIRLSSMTRGFRGAVLVESAFAEIHNEETQQASFQKTLLGS